jgi:hypothetical protein
MAARPLDAACVAPSGLPQGARTRAGHDWATRGSDCWTRAEVDGAKRSPPCTGGRTNALDRFTT